MAFRVTSRVKSPPKFHPRFSYCNFFLDILTAVMDLAMSNGAFFTLNTDTQREKIGQGKKITIICYFFHLKIASFCTIRRPNTNLHKQFSPIKNTER